MSILKLILFIPMIALVQQGLFFSLYASENKEAQSSFIPIREKSCWDQARQYAERGLVDLAIPEFQRLIESFPANGEAHIYLAWAYSQKGWISHTVEELEKALSLNPELQKIPFDYPMPGDISCTVKEFTTGFEEMIHWVGGFPGAYAELGLCYMMLGRLSDALREYKKILKLNPYYGKKDLLINGREVTSTPDQAIKEYEEVLRLKPEYADAYIRLACAYAEKGMLDVSIANMRRALSIEPDRADTHVYLAYFYAKKWMMGEALRELREAKQIKERILVKLIGEAKYYINDGMFDRAISEAKNVIDMDPKNKEAHLLLLSAYSKSGNMSQAIETGKEIICLFPEDAHAYVLLGWVYVQCDLLKEAIDLAECGTRQNLGNIEMRSLIAFIHASQNQVPKAITMCHMIMDTLSADNNENNRIYDYSWVRGNVPSIEHKFREVMDVLQIKSDYPEAYVSLGWLHSKNGEGEKAAAAFRKAIEFMPDSHDAHVHLGNVYLQKGEISSALQEYSRASEIFRKKARDDMIQGLESLKKGEIEQAIACFNTILKVDPEYKEVYASLADAYEKKGLYGIGMVLRSQNR